MAERRDTTPPPSSVRPKDAGWEVGVRTTVDASPERIWSFLLGDGLPIWLGKTTLTLEKGARWATDDDIGGTVIGFTEGSRLRLTWQPGEWNHDSTLRVTLRAVEGGTTISFDQERLAGRDERKIMLGHWKEVLQDLADAL
jgi:uncharacterized protein YndB with AHSA1/START domain